MWLTWLRAVFSLTTSFAAISLFVAPSAISTSTSRSRAVRSPSSPAPACAATSFSTTPLVTFESSSDSPRATDRSASSRRARATFLST